MRSESAEIRLNGKAPTADGPCDPARTRNAADRPNPPFCPPQTDGKQAPTPPPPANRSQNRRGNRPENRLPARKTAGFHIKKRSKFKSLKTALTQYPLGPNAIVQGAKYKQNASACQAGRPAPHLRPIMRAQHAARDLAARRIAVTGQGVRLACAFMAV